MKNLLVISVLLILTKSTFAQSYGSAWGNQSIELLKTEVKKQPRTKLQDSLIENLDMVNQNARYIQNKADLKKLQDYFMVAQYTILNDQDNNGRTALAFSKLNQDLNLKLLSKANSENISALLESFYKMKEVGVQVKIKGIAPTTGAYRLFWVSNFGTAPSKLISDNIFEGSSTMLQSPYKMMVKLPGFITFWLKDTSTNVFYIPDTDYFPMNENSLSVEVNFKPLQ